MELATPSLVSRQGATLLKSSCGLLGVISSDELAMVCSFLPVVDILTLARASHGLYCLVDTLPSWRPSLELLWPDDAIRPLPNTLSLGEGLGEEPAAIVPPVWRVRFLERAAVEMNWRRGRPQKVVQQSMGGDEDGAGRATTQAIQSLHVHSNNAADGRTVLLTGMGGEATVSILQEGSDELVHVARIRAHDQAKINTIRGTRNFICTTGMDHKVKLFDWHSGCEVRVLQSHTSSVWGLDVDEAVNPHMLVSSGYCVASLTDLRSAAPPVTLRAHATWIRSLQVDLSRHLLVTGSCDATCRSWDLRTGRQLGKYQHPDHFEEVRHVAFHGDTLLTGCYDGLVRSYDLPTARLQRVVAEHHKVAVECAVFTDLASCCVSVDWSGLLCFSPLLPCPSADGDEAKVPDVDIESVMYGTRRPVNPPPHLRGINRYRLIPTPLADGQLSYTPLAPSDPVPSADAMSSAVCCMQASGERLFMGRRDGRLVQLLFKPRIA